MEKIGKALLAGLIVIGLILPFAAYQYTELEQVKKRNKALEEELAKTKLEKKALGEKVEELQKENKELTAKLLEDRDHDGFSNFSAKAILKWAKTW